MVFTGSILSAFSDNSVVVFVAIILSTLAYTFLYQSYLILKYLSLDVLTPQDILINKSIGIFVLLGMMWIFVFAIITIDRGHWENVWVIFTVPVFGSFGVGCLWFFRTIRKYTNRYKWILLLIGILFVTLYFPITLMQMIQVFVV
jgi:hypothetical protein